MMRTEEEIRHSHLEFERVRQMDPTVASMMEREFGPEAIIVALAREKQQLMDRIFTLEGIRPRRIRTKDGRDLQFDLIPIEPL